MDILDRISELLGNKEQKELTEYLGLQNSAFSDWKTGKSKSFRRYLIEISEFFNVSIDYLVYGKEKNLSSELTDTEYELLEKFRNLSDINKGKIIERMEVMTEQTATIGKEISDVTTNSNNIPNPFTKPTNTD
ncbi:MAG: helix-turn-helix domain containing protein [Ruminococcus sp.]|nr:helix-turn-helix domain containing protein [Ruminococcus sp.]MCM1380294.1 helix-turn-helix domain containing protein [Muribaculaceae bacterium]MCM1478274.1 helix-turn-helix domain containing protein [Muribaculaceae bacterium]